MKRPLLDRRLLNRVVAQARAFCYRRGHHRSVDGVCVDCGLRIPSASDDPAAAHLLNAKALDR